MFLFAAVCYVCVCVCLHAFNRTTQYAGEWRAGKRTGVGAMHFADGTRFEGEYSGGMEQGYGLAWAADGQRNDGFKVGDVEVEQWEGMWDVRSPALQAAGAARQAQLAADSEARAARAAATYMIDYRASPGGGLRSILACEQRRVEREGGKGARRSGAQPRAQEVARLLHICEERQAHDKPPPLPTIPAGSIAMA